MKNEKSLIHLTQYYETDQMNVIHHANYVKWMEEARTNFFKEIGIDLSIFDKKKVSLAVLFQSVNYQKYVKFNERIEIKCRCVELSNIKIKFEYDFFNLNQNCICAKGTTNHCFVNDKMEPVILKKKLPAIYELIKKCTL